MYRKCLDPHLGFRVDLSKPSVLHLPKAGIIAGGEGVLECETGGYPDLGLGLLIGELGGKCLKVALLQ